MIVIELDMINITKTRHVHITLLVPIRYQRINLTLALTNAPLVIRIPLLDAINHLTALLQSHHRHSLSNTTYPSFKFSYL